MPFSHNSAMLFQKNLESTLEIQLNKSSSSAVSFLVSGNLSAINCWSSSGEAYSFI